MSRFTSTAERIARWTSRRQIATNNCPDVRYSSWKDYPAFIFYRIPFLTRRSQIWLGWPIYTVFCYLLCFGLTSRFSSCGSKTQKVCYTPVLWLNHIWRICRGRFLSHCAVCKSPLAVDHCVCSNLLHFLHWNRHLPCIVSRRMKRNLNRKNLRLRTDGT